MFWRWLLAVRLLDFQQGVVETLDDDQAFFARERVFAHNPARLEAIIF